MQSDEQHYNNKIKICYISNPNSIHTQRWLGWFSGRGHQVSLIADLPYYGNLPDIEVHDLTRHFNIRVLRFAVWALFTRRLLRRWQPDILHAHRVNSAGWLGAFSGYHPFVVTPWGSDLLTHPNRSRVASWLAKYVLTRADWITTDSQTLRRRAIQFGAHQDRSEVIQFGVDSSVYQPDLDTTRLRQQLKIGSGPVVLSSRALAPIYNIDVIIAAIPAVLRKLPETVFVFKEFNVDLAYKARVAAQIEGLGITEHVRWVGPAQNEEEIATLYCLADIIVSVPSSDSTSSSLLEAMACGKPLIVSDLPSMHEWIKDGENGLLIPTRDPASLSNAFCALLDDKDELTAFGSKNRAIILERADHQTEMKKVESIYFHLLECV